jgi:hypothetical protein
MDYLTENVDVDTISKEQLERIWNDPTGNFKARREYLAKKYN